MRAVVQRVSSASVHIDGVVHSKISRGLLVLLGICHEDKVADVTWLAQKLVQMRIFGDAAGKMNLALGDINGDLLVVSQFTLHAATKKGNRPSFIDAARPEVAIPLYELFISRCSELMGKSVASGVFGADMQVELLNDGPVTIILDSSGGN
jgi:D-tyrosyl-tRNA(Tyr) deacylase